MTREITEGNEFQNYDIIRIQGKARKSKFCKYLAEPAL